MTDRVPITAEIVKMAQLRSRATACDLRQETARQIAQETILALDPELNLLIDEDLAFSRDDRLVSILDVNDVVVNSVRFDVRVVGEDGRVSVPRHLVGTSYLNGGTLAVSISPDRSAAVVGYVPCSDWDLQDKHVAQSDDKLIFRVASGNFDLEQLLPTLLKSINNHSHKQSRAVHSTEISQFCGHQQEMTLVKQRDFVEAVLSNEDCWNELQLGISKSFVRRTLKHASLWNRKLDNIADTLQSKFQRLSRDEIKASIAKIGEQLGGQSDSALFRKEMLLSLTREELSRSLNGEAFTKASKLVEQVFSGRPVIDVLKDTVKNKTAIDLATTIKRQRQKVANFIEASSDEISQAFRQLALQPVYATHSPSEEDGLESVNEALRFLDACELAESLIELEHNLA